VPAQFAIAAADYDDNSNEKNQKTNDDDDGSMLSVSAVEAGLKTTFTTSNTPPCSPPMTR
jgi:hypothetical protein